MKSITLSRRCTGADWNVIASSLLQFQSLKKNHIYSLLWITYFGILSVSSQCRKNTVFREGYRLHDPSLCPSFLASRVFWREWSCLRKTETKLCIPAPGIPGQAIWGWEHLSSLLANITGSDLGATNKGKSQLCSLLTWLWMAPVSLGLTSSPEKESNNASPSVVQSSGLNTVWP